MVSDFAKEAQSGFAPAEAYDAHRPTYPPEAVEQLLQHLEIAGVERAKVADLAAGTGKFTVPLAARPEQYEIIAIEPHDQMREQLRRKDLKNVKVVDGTAEKMPEVADGSLAALVAAQSFHWFANKEALQEIHRVLQPTGVLGMIWNIEDYNAPISWEIHPGWETKMRDVIFSFDDYRPRFRHDKWHEIFDEQSNSNPFTLHASEPLFSLPIGQVMIKFETWLSKDDLWSRFRTLSQIAVLEGEELKKVRDIYLDAINAPDTVTDEQGRVAVHGQTVLAWTSRIPSEPLKSGG